MPEKYVYDANGNIISRWALGTAALNSDYDPARATVDVYDALGQITSETGPGNSNATTSTYDMAGNLLEQDNPDGSFTRYTYDSDGNKLSEVTPLSNYDPQNPTENIAETTSSYDLADRLVAEVDPSNLETDHSYDLLGREISATGQSGDNPPSSTTEYNVLGWVLQKVDADGVTDATTYDTHGNAVSETIGDKTTTSTYDSLDRLLTQDDASDNLLTNTYDAFGNLTQELHQGPLPPYS